MVKEFTRKCTPVYYGPVEEGLHRPEMVRRPVEAVTHFDQRVFSSDDRFDGEYVKNALLGIQKKAVLEKTGCTVECELEKAVEKPVTWRDKVNAKKAFIKRVIEKHGDWTVSEIAQFTYSSRNTVKKTMREMRMFGDVEDYCYNFLKTEEEKERLDVTLDLVEDSYMTVNCVKRLHPTFSRFKIRKAMKDRGLRYRMMKTVSTKPPRIPNSTRICRVISHITQALCDPSTTVMYVDEMKFPLKQTAKKKWQHKDLPDSLMMVENARPVEKTTLTVIALCSLKKFEAVQVYSGEVTAVDFVYFLNNAMASLPPRQSYTIVADNATWHKADLVSATKVSKFLFFNEPKIFQLNMVENAFSFVRHAFRIRRTVETVEEEICQIVNLFFDSKNEKRFKGYYRNHLRMLVEFLEKHKMK